MKTSRIGRAFHRTLVEAAGNPALDFAAAGVIESLQPAVNMVIFRFRDRPRSQLSTSACIGVSRRETVTLPVLRLTDYMSALRRQYC